MIALVWGAVWALGVSQAFQVMSEALPGREPLLCWKFSPCETLASGLRRTHTCWVLSILLRQGFLSPSWTGATQEGALASSIPLTHLVSGSPERVSSSFTWSSPLGHKLLGFPSATEASLLALP